MATSGNKSFESTKIDSGRTSSITVDGCLAGRRPLCGRKKKNKKKKKTCHSLSQTKWRSWENLSNRFSSFLGVHQMLLATFRSVKNASCSCRGMWKQQSKRSIGFGLDRAASRPRHCARASVWIFPVQPAPSCWIALGPDHKLALRWQITVSSRFEERQILEPGEGVQATFLSNAFTSLHFHVFIYPGL